MRSHIRLGLALAILVPLFAGCIGAGENASGPSADPASTDATGAEEVFEPRTYTLVVPYYVRAASVDSQNMEETNWELEVPANATEVRASASWEPSTPLARDQGLMLHEGSKQDAGAMFGEPGLGSSPIETPWAEIPEGLDTVTIMCHVYTSGPTQPVGVEFQQETEIVVEFR